MKYFTKEIKIALSGIVAVAMLFFGINFLRGINLFKSSNSYYFSYENICGLVNSSPVYANGFNIGIVRNISYDYNHPGHIVVEIEVDKDMRIPKGTHGELEVEMLGTVKMNLVFPKTQNGNYNVGDTIPGKVASGLLDTAYGMVPQIERILPKLDSIAHSLNQLLADPALAATLQHTEQLTANLESSSRHLNTLLSKDMPQMTGKLNTICDNFVTVSDNLSKIDFANTMQEVNTTLANVKLLTEKLNRKDNSLGLLLNDREFYDNLNATSANAASLMKDIQDHPKRYVHFSVFGKKDK